MRWIEHRIPPPVVGALVAAAMWAVAGPGPQFVFPSGPRYAAIGILPEERVLESIFGDEYRAYAARVRRWL